MSRALVVIDVQNEYDADAHPGAVWPVVGRASSLAAVATAVDAANAAGVPVVLVQHGEEAAAPVFATGGTGWQLHDVVASRPHDVVVAKQWPDAFTGTTLEAWLREHDVDTVAICGYMAQHCVDSTTRRAYHLGFTVELLADATGTLDMVGADGEVIPAEQITATVLAVLGSEFARVAPAADWADAVRAGAPLPEPSLLDALRPRVGA